MAVGDYEDLVKQGQAPARAIGTDIIKFDEFNTGLENSEKIKSILLCIAVDSSRVGSVNIEAPASVSARFDISGRKPEINIRNIRVIRTNGEREELISYISNGKYNGNKPTDAQPGTDCWVPVCGITPYDSTKVGKDKTYENFGDIVLTIYCASDADKDFVVKNIDNASTGDNASGLVKSYTAKTVTRSRTVIWNGTVTSPEIYLRQKDIAGAKAWDPVITSGGSNKGTNGLGAKGDTLDENGFMDFATLISSIAFVKNFNSSFNADGTTTLHEYISRNLVRFYHQIYYIPTLRKNYGIVVKPETLFTRPPSCNIIYPNMKNQLSYARNIRSEPTRVMQYTDPLSGFSNQASSPIVQLVTILNVEESKVYNTVDGKKIPVTRFDMPVYHTYVQSLADHTSLTEKNLRPMTSISNYEKRNGLFGLKTQRGADLYSYITAGRKSVKNEKTNKYETKYVFNGKDNASNESSVGQKLGKLARYDLISARYKTRAGSATMYFNPYIVPGFPFASLEPNVDGLNVFGYVTDVAHNITDRDWTTTINFNCARGDVEYAPVAFPIVESDWTRNLASTYKNMLGDTVTEVTNADIPVMVADYNTDKKYTSTSFRKIWRELTSFDEYLEDIADGATVVEDKNYLWIRNSDKSNFFDEELQQRIRQYSAEILQYHIPYTNDDVR